MFPVRKRSGGIRHIHAVNGRLYKIHSFINKDILQRWVPHSASFAFHASGGIYNCALKHCSCGWLLQFDLRDFFYSISEPMVYNAFRSLGYKRLLSFEMARLCTTEHVPINKKHYLKRFVDRRYSFKSGFPYPSTKSYGVLPQGAPSSPMISNIVAHRLDNVLSDYASHNGFMYTRYADDITFSTPVLAKNKIGKVVRHVVSCVRKAGFIENKKKIRIAGPGARKQVLGLLVDQSTPRISKKTFKRIDRLIYSIDKYGLDSVAKHDGFDSAYGLYNHVYGLLCHVKDVDGKRWEKFYERFAPIKKRYDLDLGERVSD